MAISVRVMQISRRRERSAGRKQIFAIALLFALPVTGCEGAIEFLDAATTPDSVWEEEQEREQQKKERCQERCRTEYKRCDADTAEDCKEAYSVCYVECGI